MPEATAAGITKTAARQAAAHPWSVHPTDTSGNSYSQSQVLNWVQAATDRNGS